MDRLAFTVKREMAAVLSDIDLSEYSGSTGAFDFCKPGRQSRAGK